MSTPSIDAWQLQAESASASHASDEPVALPATIGRHDASLVVEHRDVSKLHCRVWAEDDAVFIVDKSKNGTTSASTSGLSSTCHTRC